MLLFLAIVSGIFLSLEITYENQVFDTSKLTFNAMGIIELNITINLIKITISNPLSIVIINYNEILITAK